MHTNWNRLRFCKFYMKELANEAQKCLLVCIFVLFLSRKPNELTDNVVVLVVQFLRFIQVRSWYAFTSEYWQQGCREKSQPFRIYEGKLKEIEDTHNPASRLEWGAAKVTFAWFESALRCGSRGRAQWPHKPLKARNIKNLEKFSLFLTAVTFTLD